MSSLSLEAKDSEAVEITDKVLLGKLISARLFKRFNVESIIIKSGSLRARVKIERLEDNLFKLSFENKDDKVNPFHKRPWSMNGAHLVLKEWL